MMVSSPLPLISWFQTVLLSALNSTDSSVIVQQAALDLFVLGYPSRANKLIHVLYKYGQGITFNHYSKRTMISLYDAWEATGTTPSYISNPDQDKVFNGRDDSEKSRDLWRGLDRIWVRGLPREWRKKALNGGLSKDELDIAIQRLNINPENLSVIGPIKDPSEPEESMTLGAVVQVALLLDKEDVARDLIEKHLPNLYRHVRDQSKCPTTLGDVTMKWLEARLGLHHSPRIWNVLKSTHIGQILNIDEDALDAFVAEGCAIIKERFTHGPSRPYADFTIPELVGFLNNDNPNLVPKPNNAPRACFIYLPDEPSTYVQPPATASQVTELELRLQGDSTEEAAQAMYAHEKLPEDYKAYLLASNGFCPAEMWDDPGPILYNTECVASYGIQFLHDYDFELFPSHLHGEDLRDNISLGDFMGFSIGAGGDEGNVILYPPSSVKPVLEAFEKVYSTACDRERREYERAAVSLYGGIEKLRETEWLCTLNFHWSGDQEIFSSFREFFEYLVGYVVMTRYDKEKVESEED